jgi:hypothetical protein
MELYHIKNNKDFLTFFENVQDKFCCCICHYGNIQNFVKNVSALSDPQVLLLILGQKFEEAVLV